MAWTECLREGRRRGCDRIRGFDRVTGKALRTLEAPAPMCGSRERLLLWRHRPREIVDGRADSCSPALQLRQCGRSRARKRRRTESSQQEALPRRPVSHPRLRERVRPARSRSRAPTRSDARSPSRTRGRAAHPERSSERFGASCRLAGAAYGATMELCLAMLWGRNAALRGPMTATKAKLGARTCREVYALPMQIRALFWGSR